MKPDPCWVIGWENRTVGPGDIMITGLDLLVTVHNAPEAAARHLAALIANGFGPKPQAVVFSRILGGCDHQPTVDPKGERLSQEPFVGMSGTYNPATDPPEGK